MSQNPPLNPSPDDEPQGWNAPHTSSAFRRQQIEIWLFRNPTHPDAAKWRTQLRVLGFVSSREEGDASAPGGNAYDDSREDPRFWREPGVEPFVNPDAIAEVPKPARAPERIRSLLERLAQEDDEQ